jgi:hypothetical protein
MDELSITEVMKWLASKKHECPSKINNSKGGEVYVMKSCNGKLCH